MQENTRNYWINMIAKRLIDLGLTMQPFALQKAAKKMQRIAACERVPDLDMIVRFHADPTYEAAVKNLETDHAYQQRLANRSNAARRVAA